MSWKEDLNLFLLRDQMPNGAIIYNTNILVFFFCYGGKQTKFAPVFNIF